MSIISKDISKAIELLSNDNLVAIPTETVYGLAGNIYSEKAIKCIFETKQRPFFNPLIVHISSIDKLDTIVESIPEKAMLLAQHFWPGSLTLVLKKKPHIPDIITAHKDTVAVRVPNHSLTLQLLEQLPFPLAAPSANPFTKISPTKPEHVEKYFKDTLSMVLDGGNCKNGIESTIVGFENEEPVVYRLGAVAFEDIENVVGTVTVKNKKEVAPNAPGMLERHYAPRTTTVLSTSLIEDIKKHEGKRIGVLSFGNHKFNEAVFQIVLSETNNLEEAASKLYDALHQLDTKDLDIIIAEKCPDFGLGKSINDRLLRATK